MSSIKDSGHGTGWGHNANSGQYEQHTRDNFGWRGNSSGQYTTKS